MTLGAPEVAEYWMTMSLQPGGVIVFDGYAPDQATIDAFSRRQGADTSFIKVGRGAPAAYQDAADLGLLLLSHLSDGRVALRNNVVTVAGTAKSSGDYAELLAALSKPAPKGLALGRSDVAAPKADVYTWSAERRNDGSVLLAGYVPDEQLEASLLRAAGDNAASAMTYASGQPNNFNKATAAALTLLGYLAEGSVRFDGKAWLLTGTPLSPSDRDAIEQTFRNEQLASAGWAMALSTISSSAPAIAQNQPAANQSPASAPEVTVSPIYAFSATRGIDGKIIMSGQLPADPALRYFTIITQGDSAAVSIAEGAPDSFLPSAEVGLRALVLLSEGQLDFSAGQWRLTGAAPDAATAQAVLAALAADSTTRWQSDIDAPPAGPSATETASVQPQPSPATALAACRGPLADFSERNAILFQSGAAVITGDSAPALDELARDLSACPDAIVHVEGHTDADGDEQANLALSVARAEAVVKALVERQVNPDRLYAVGYGEMQPMADNDTAEGKRLNRRIVIKVLEGEN